MQLHASVRDFDAVYRAHHDFVWRTLRHLGVDEARVDDALQDTFLVVHRRLAEFAGRAALRTWLFEIARRVAGRYRRTAAREAPRRCEVPDVQSPAQLDDDLARAEAAEILALFLDELDRDKSVVFIMAELEQRRVPEIAETLDLNLNTVYARLRAARIQLDRLINRLQARERRPRIRRATEVVAAALLLEIPAAPARAWPALPVAAAASYTASPALLAALALGALALGATLLPPRVENTPAVPTGARSPVPTDIPPPPAPVPADIRPAPASPVPADIPPAPASPVPTDIPPPPASPVSTDTSSAPPAPVPTDSSSAPAAPVPTDSSAPPAPVPTDISSAPASPVPPTPSARELRATAEHARAALLDPVRPASLAGLEQELALIEPARAALLADDPRAALRLLTDHRRQFPSGVFAQEAGAARVEALCRLGDRRRAADERAEFLARWPDSALRPWLQTVCGE